MQGLSYCLMILNLESIVELKVELIVELSVELNVE